MSEKELKEAFWYNNLVKAWFNSSLVKDCLLALFFLVSLVIYSFKDMHTSDIGMFFAILGLANNAIIFGSNQKYLKALVANEEPKSIKVFDIINWILFVTNSFCLIIGTF